MPVLPHMPSSLLIARFCHALFHSAKWKCPCPHVLPLKETAFLAAFSDTVLFYLIGCLSRPEGRQGYSCKLLPLQTITPTICQPFLGDIQLSKRAWPTPWFLKLEVSVSLFPLGIYLLFWDSSSDLYFIGGLFKCLIASFVPT